MIVTCIGKLNIDFNYSVDTVEIGKNHVSENVETSIGGKATNIAVALRKLSIPTQLIANVGADEFGTNVISQLESFNVIPLINVKPGTRTGFTFIVVESDGRNTMFNYPGANAMLCVEDIALHEKTLKNSDLIFYQVGAGESDEILSYLKTLDKPIFLELCEHVEPKILDGVDFASLNEEEALRITETKNTFEAISILLDFGIKNIFMKLGAKGSIHACQEKITYGEPYMIDVVDTTGAGDAFSAGCIYGILNHFPTEKILPFANKCGALTCTRKGTTMAFPTIEELQRFK
ncbi:carbohydrate kinase family protein [Fervidobacterium sp.]